MGHGLHDRDFVTLDQARELKALNRRYGRSLVLLDKDVKRRRAYARLRARERRFGCSLPATTRVWAALRGMALRASRQG